MQIYGISISSQWRSAWNKNWAHPQLDRVEVYVAYCSLYGAQELLNAQAMRGTPVRLLVGVKNGVTDLATRDTLFDWQTQNSNIKIKTLGSNKGLFHPKVYVFHCGDTTRVLIGSVNLTQSAFERNDEAALSSGV